MGTCRQRSSLDLVTESHSCSSSSTSRPSFFVVMDSFVSPPHMPLCCPSVPHVAASLHILCPSPPPCGPSGPPCTPPSRACSGRTL